MTARGKLLAALALAATLAGMTWVLLQIGAQSAGRPGCSYQVPRR